MAVDCIEFNSYGVLVLKTVDFEWEKYEMGEAFYFIPAS